MELLIISFLAGVLTVLTPCVLPVLPVVLGGSLSGQSPWRPLVITLSLMVSIFLFTLLLKASTFLIDVPPNFWTSVSGVIVLIFGLALLFPGLWSRLSSALGGSKSELLLQQAGQQEGARGMVLLGVALGPVFASCSPTYALILAVVLPQSFSMGVSALVMYCLGLFLPLLLIGYGGRRILVGFRWFADPTSWFRKGLGLLLVVVAVLILTGYEKKLETALLNQGYFDFTKLEQGLLESLEETDMFSDKQEEMDRVMLDLKKTDPRDQLLNAAYTAPEFVDPQNWINSEPLSLKQLEQENKVVIVDFWTFSCVNCIRTFPALRALHEKYADQGLVIVGVHAPEFAFERKLENVQKSVEQYALKYPIFLDNDFKTWRAYRNRFWPAKYIVDADGIVRYTHFGEGAYEETEEVVRYLLEKAGTLKEAEEEMIDFSGVDSPSSGIATSETYLGTERHVVAGSVSAISSGQALFVSPESVSSEVTAYSVPESLEGNQWALEGEWMFDEEKIVSQSEESSITLRYKASEANLVLGFQEDPVLVEVWLDGKKISVDDSGASLSDGEFIVDAFQLYFLADHEQVEEHTIELRFLGKGVEAYAFTFG